MEYGKMVEKYEAEINELINVKNNYLLQIETIAESLKELEDRNEELEEKLKNTESYIATVLDEKE